MNKTDIDWADYSINPVKGLCPMACEYCYARRMYKRFKWNETITFMGKYNLLNELLKIPKEDSQKIFVGSTIELFGDWIKPEWMEDIFELVRTFSFFTFIFLTKQPQNLIKWSPFPKNVWVGTSIPRCWDEAGRFEAFQRISKLGEVKAPVKFISFEPLLESIASEFDFGLDMSLKAYGINWLIIGQQTPIRPQTTPKIEWVKEIVDAADKANIPVFLKDNLKPLLRLNDYNLYSFPEWAGKQFAMTGDHSLAPSNPHANEPMRNLRQEFPVALD